MALALLAWPGLFWAGYSVPRLVIFVIGATALALKGLDLKKQSFIPMAVLMLVAVNSAIYAPDAYNSLVGQYNGYTLGLMGMFIAMVFYLGSGEDISILPYVGVVIGLHALYQIAIGQTVAGRAVGLIGHPAHTGIVLAVLLPLSKSYVKSLAMVLGLLACGSRGAMLAGVIGLWVAKCD